MSKLDVASLALCLSPASSGEGPACAYPLGGVEHGCLCWVPYLLNCYLGLLWPQGLSTNPFLTVSV